MSKLMVLATKNEHKVKEFREILKDVGVELRSLSDFGPIPDAIEDGDTFDDNAYKKANHVARFLGIPAIADDSGLVVKAMGGAPGVYSARYAGPGATDDNNIDKLLREMENITDRSAYFHCVLSIAVPSGPALTYEGKCEGTLLYKRKGDGGFGYDPIFFVKKLNKSFAELTMEEKNSISHRGMALLEFRQEIQKVMKWINIRMEEEKPPKPDHNQFLGNDWSKG